MRRLAQYAETCDLNRVEMGDTKLGIITSSTSYQYVKEVFGKKPLSSSWDGPPLCPRTDPGLRRQGGPTGGGGGAGPHHRKLLPSAGPNRFRQGGPAPGGEFSQNLVAASWAARYIGTALEDAIPPRPPVMCAGCPHRGLFYTLAKNKCTVLGDIGCYTLGAVAPLNAMEMTLCMGASISGIHGFNKALGRKARGRRWPSSETPPSCTPA